MIIEKLRKKYEGINNRISKIFNIFMVALLTYIGSYSAIKIEQPFLESSKMFKQALFYLEKEDFSKVNSLLLETEKEPVDIIKKKFGSQKASEYFKYLDKKATNLDYLCLGASIGGKISTSLELVDLIENKQSIVFGDKEGNLFFSENNKFRRVGLGSYPTGKIYYENENGKKKLVVASSSGLIQAIIPTKSENPKNQLELTVKTIYDAKCKISPLTAIDFNNDGKNEYFFNTEDGEVIGIDGEGNKIFKFYKGAETRYLIPVAFFDIDLDGKPEIVTNTDKEVIALTNKQKAKVLWGYNAEAKSEIAIGNITNDSKQEILFRAGDHLVALDYLGNQLWKKWIELGSDDPEVNYITLSDTNNDGLEEIILRCNSGLAMIDGKGSTLFKYNTNSTAIYSKPVTQDINQDNVPEIIFGVSDGNLYILSNKGDIIFNHRFPGNNRGDCIRFVYKNGMPDIVFHSDGYVQTIGNSWLNIKTNSFLNNKYLPHSKTYKK